MRHKNIWSNLYFWRRPNCTKLRCLFKCGEGILSKVSDKEITSSKNTTVEMTDFIPEHFMRFSSAYEASTLSSGSLSKSKDSSSCGMRIEHAMECKSSYSIEWRKLAIQVTVMMLALAKLGMPLAMEFERAASNLLFPLLNKTVAAFLCQSSVASSSSF